VHLLSLPSANALLKLLEDPPPGTLFFLLAERVTDLPSTLLSRCQLLTWPPEEAPSREGAGTGRPGSSPAEEVLEAVAGGKGSGLLLLAKRLAESGAEVMDDLAVLVRERVARMVRAGEQSAAVPWLRAWEAVDRAASRLEQNGNPRLVWECLLLDLAELLGAPR
jgi:DNA polymerase-3 subunit delta'